MKHHLLKTLTAVLAIASMAIGPANGQNAIVCTSQDVGKILCSDGSIYATVSDATAANKTAVAKIVHLNMTIHKGLALALSEGAATPKWEDPAQDAVCLTEYDNDTKFDDMAGINNTATLVRHAHHPAAAAANNYAADRPAGASEWFLPSAGQWNIIMESYGIENLTTTAGGYTGMVRGSDYWTSTENATDRAWRFRFDANEYTCAWIAATKDSYKRVRACFEFNFVELALTAPTYTVRFADGTVDSANWTLTPAEATTTGIRAGDSLTATYAGTRKVKSVKAVRHDVVWDGNLARIPASALEADGKTVIVPNGMTLYGHLDYKYKIVIAAGATVILNGIGINGEDRESYSWAGLTCLGDATLILKDSSSNWVEGFDAKYPSIQPGPANTTLTIRGENDGSGKLYAMNYGYGAGIGGGYGISCGNIVIQSGIIRAEAAKWSAGIGSGHSVYGDCTCGSITISGGTVTAKGGWNAAAIGAGEGDYDYTIHCGPITISPDVVLVTATKGDASTHNVGHGYGNSTCSTVTIGGTVYWTGQAYQNGGQDLLTRNTLVYPIYISSIAIGPADTTIAVGKSATLRTSLLPANATNPTVSWSSDNTSVATVDDNGVVTALAVGTAHIIATANDYGRVKDTCTVTVDPAWDGNLAVILPSALEADGKTLYTANGMTLFGTLGNNYKIVIPDGDTVTLNGATINREAGPNDTWAGITCQGDATIILKDGSANTVKGFHGNYPGLFVPQQKTLTLQGETAGTGSLNARSSSYGAGIGGAYGIPCGTIAIKGGVISASGGEDAAGIGSANGTTCDAIIISGGTVTATGGGSAAGIGSGNEAYCGAITINGSGTQVTATRGINSPNSVGRGYGNSTCGTITIDGTVYWNNTDYENDGDFYLTRHTFLYPIVWDGNLAHIPSSALEADGVTLFVPNGMTLTDTLNADYKITIAAGDTVILDNAVIIGENNENFPWAGINCLGDATIILKDGSTNSVKGFYEEYPGIHVPSGSTLTLQGTGALTATSNGWAAGIGGGYNISCGNIHIKGGTITATGGNTAAAIGGGRYACGDITISGGTVNATGGSYASGIGGGYRDLCGDITITTGVTLLTATKGNDAPNSIGAGDEGACGTVTVGDREYSNGITKSPYTYPEPIVLVTSITLNKSVSTLAVGAFEILSVTTVVPDSATDQSVSWNSSDESKATVDQNGRVTAVAAGTALIIATTNDGSDVKDTCTMTVVEPVTWDGNLSMIPVTALEADGVTLFVPNGMTLTDTLNADYKITIAAGDTVILDNAVIIGENDENYPWAGITCLGDATIILKDGSTNSVTGFYEGYPGIHIASGGTLTLQGETAGTGALTVTCNGWAAAIGGGYENLHCGNIHIKGGVITATGRGCAAAIGGGRTSDCGNITISGGTVNANGGSVAAAIGGGQLSNCGDITITTGVTRVTVTMGTDATYSIGKGVGSNVTCGTITIGGTVYPDGITQSPYTYPIP